MSGDADLHGERCADLLDRVRRSPTRERGALGAGLTVEGEPPARPPWRPAPLVGPWSHLLRFLVQKTHLLAVAVVMAYFGQLVIVALYDLLLETNPTVTHGWHALAVSAGLRHDIRSSVEGLRGGLFAQPAVWNAVRRRRPITVLDRAERHVGIPTSRLVARVRRKSLPLFLWSSPTSCPDPCPLAPAPICCRRMP